MINWNEPIEIRSDDQWKEAKVVHVFENGSALLVWGDMRYSRFAPHEERVRNSLPAWELNRCALDQTAKEASYPVTENLYLFALCRTAARLGLSPQQLLIAAQKEPNCVRVLIE